MILILEDIGERVYMEDRLAFKIDIINGFDYLAVFDGHGGAQVATYLKAHMANIIKEFLQNAFTANPQGLTVEQVKQVLYDSFKQVVKQIPTSISLLTGSTAVVALKHGKHVWVANCGDSRAIINDGAFGVIEMSVDHKPDRQDEYERITRTGGSVGKAFHGDVNRVNGMLAVSRSVGDFHLYPHVTWEPEIKYLEATKKNAYIFMGTDGIWDVLSNKEVVDIVNACIIKGQYKVIGKEIVTLARKRGSGDNIAFLIAPI